VKLLCYGMATALWAVCCMRRHHGQHGRHITAVFIMLACNLERRSEDQRTDALAE
jgi:hypothetical protein